MLPPVKPSKSSSPVAQSAGVPASARLLQSSSKIPRNTSVPRLATSIPVPSAGSVTVYQTTASVSKSQEDPVNDSGQASVLSNVTVSNSQSAAKFIAIASPHRSLPSGDTTELSSATEIP